MGLALITKFILNTEIGMLIGILHYAMRVVCFAVTHAEETMSKFMSCNFPDFVLMTLMCQQTYFVCFLNQIFHIYTNGLSTQFMRDYIKTFMENCRLLWITGIQALSTKLMPGHWPASASAQEHGGSNKTAA